MSFFIPHACSLSKICPVDTMFLNQLIDPNLGVKVFFKQEEGKKGKLILTKRIEAPLQTIIGG